MLNGSGISSDRSPTFASPMRGAASRIQAKAPTKGGMNIGSIARRSSSRTPGTLVRTSVHASATPMMVANALDPAEIRIVSPSDRQ